MNTTNGRVSFVVDSSLIIKSEGSFVLLWNSLFSAKKKMYKSLLWSKEGSEKTKRTEGQREWWMLGNSDCKHRRDCGNNKRQRCPAWEEAGAQISVILRIKWIWDLLTESLSINLWLCVWSQGFIKANEQGKDEEWEVKILHKKNPCWAVVSSCRGF